MFSGKLWPNGEWGVCKVKKMPEYIPPRGIDEETNRWNFQRYLVHGFEAAVMAAWQERSFGDGWDERPQAASLGSSMLANSHRRVSRGAKGISRYGSKMVRNAAYMLEKGYGIKHLSFLTLTLPPVGEGLWVKVCENWSNIVRVFLQRLQRWLKRSGLPDFVISVTEIQEERHNRTGEPGLHLHMVFVGRRKKETWKLKPQQVRSWWKEIVCNSLQCSSDTFNWGSVERLESIRKSAASYLGKYLSKGVSSINALVLKCPSLRLPSSWWNCSSALRKWVKSQITPLTGQVGRQLWDLPACFLDTTQGWWTLITLGEVKGEGYVVGMAGKTRPEYLEMFRELLGCRLTSFDPT